MLFKFYLFGLSFLLPLDWFEPTGKLLREFGAKPACAWLVMGAVAGFLSSAKLKESHLVSFYGKKIFASWFFLLLLGLIGFVLTLLTIDTSGFEKSPVQQFIFQLGMVSAAIFSLIGNARLFCIHKTGASLRQYMAWSAAIYLLGFLIQFFDFIPYDGLIFSGFHIAEASRAERPTSFFSEPSYYGMAAALYAGYLFFTLNVSRWKIVSVILIVGLLVSTFWIDAKTFIPTTAFGLLVLLMSSSAKNINIKTIIGAAIVIAIGSLYAIFNLEAVNVGENLSSAMRIGSTLLSLNVISDGYGIIGIGPGQFHYFYKIEYSPEFLRLAEEAYTFFTPYSEYRASTYNLISRIWLEFGVLGFCLFVYFIFKLLSLARSKESIPYVYLLGGSLGFLMTQDSYFFPPLIFSASLILAHAKSAQSQ